MNQGSDQVARLLITDMPWPLQALAIATSLVMLMGVISIFAGIVRAIFRGRLAVDPPEDAKLPVLERAYRRNTRAGLIFTSDRFRVERRLIGFGAIGLAGSFAIMGVLTLLIGR